jgi:NAD(P)-dependent dehydrogenase (short-subunit alcohol dehydrogenase family)
VSLDRKTAIVTGAARGIGLAIASRLAAYQEAARPTSQDYCRDNATLVYSALASGLRPSARTAALSLGEGAAEPQGEG